MRKRTLPLLLVALLATTPVMAQVDAQLAHYWALPTYYNPAAVGAANRMEVMAATRQQWMGMPNAPKLFLAGGEMPLTLAGSQHGVGAYIANETIGLFTNLNMSAQYAYTFELGEGEMRIGLAAGAFDQSFNASDIFIPDGSDAHAPNDPAIPNSELQGIAFDMGIGIYYQTERYHLGLASQHITQSNIHFDESYASYLARSYNFMAGCNIPLKNTLYQIAPSLLVKSTLQSTQAEFTLKGTYNKLFTGGLSYRWNEAVVVLLGAEINDFVFGYAYECPTTALIRATSGSHELYLKYRIELKRGKGEYLKHKSIRIL